MKKRHPVLLAMAVLFLLQMQVFAQATQSEVKKQLTRSQLVAMSEQQQRHLAIDFNQVEITDIVNVTAAEALHPRENAVYLTLSEYRDTDAFKQIHIIKNPDTYRIYNPQGIQSEKISEVNSSQLQSLQLLLVQMNEELENGRSNNQLNENEIQTLKEKIGVINSEIEALK